MDKRVYWIWLQNAFGPGSPKPRQIVERMGTPERFYRGGVSLWSCFSFVSDKELAALSNYGVERAAAQLQYCLSLGQKVITPDSGMYPPLLKEIFDPPAVLYMYGTMPDFTDTLWISVVGTRKAGDAGLQAAKEISFQLASAGAVVVSGGALGVDSEAHRGAIYGGGKTVAFLPCGLDYPYLIDNAMLRREILDNGGALISEFPMNTPVQRGAFQIRNRLISGVAHGALVPEAPKKSGALITARYALEQNREVFVYIGPDEKAFAGCADLVEDGAKRVLTAQDILKSFAQFRRTETPARTAAEPAAEMRRVRRRTPVYMAETEEIASEAIVSEKPVPEATGSEETVPEVLVPDAVLPEPADLSACSEAAKRVYKALDSTPRHASELEERTELPMAELLSALTELELFGLIRTFPGQRFTKV